jgi:predicted ABC-type transport system involved in lysophospholipase L1 biosynthesis ATPase subunit
VSSSTPPGGWRGLDAVAEEIGKLGRRTLAVIADVRSAEQMDAAVARALIRRPTILLCDEPTGNLDQKNADAVADLLISLHRAHDAILVFVTHSTEMARRFPRRFTLHDGRLREDPS